LKSKRLLYHLGAAFTSLIWGTTMVSTKVLLNEGLLPVEIMLVRFITAYLFLWLLYPRWQRVASWREELLFAALGVASGSLYFILENTALVYTTATNVSLICALIPLLTALFVHLALHDSKLGKWYCIGSAVSVTGAVLVILNGHFSLKIYPFGDFLAFLSIVSWALYGLLLRLLKGNYNSLFITRRIFLYSIITLLPYFIFHPFNVPVSTLSKPVVALNLAFLGLIASSLCYYLWTLCMRQLGVKQTNNYIYFNPLVTIITAHFILAEQIAGFVIFGAALIISGLIIAKK
jgi:drug/metabolite transporter (DMT)-like permease